MEDMGWPDLTQFLLYQLVLANGSRNVEFPFAISVERRGALLVDASSAILDGSPRNHGPSPSIAWAHHQDPNRGIVLAELGQFRIALSDPVDGSEN